MIHKCVWEKNTQGFYITPLIGYSNVEGICSLWFGWGPYLFTVFLNHKGEKCFRKTT